MFHYGQAMFEGMKAFRQQDGRVRLFRPLEHCRRLAEGAPRICMPAPDPAALLRGVLALTSVDESWVPSSPGTSLYLRPTLIATEAALGVKASSRYTLFVILSPVGPYYAAGWKPLRIWVEEEQVRAAPGGLGGVKAAANYVASLAASEEAKRRGYAQVLWLDAVQHQYLEEVGTMNLFVRLGDEVVTPPLAGTILGGMTRASVIQLMRAWGLRVTERAVGIDELRQAHRAGTLREVFGTGTAAVVAPVGELGFRDESLVIGGGELGELSQRLYRALQDIHSGAAPDTFGWMTDVPLLGDAPRLRAVGGAVTGP